MLQALDPPALDGSDDVDPGETREWLESLEAMVHMSAGSRGLCAEKLEAHAQYLGVAAHAPPYSAYRNTIPLEQQMAHPGDVDSKSASPRSFAGMRSRWWCAPIRAYGELGGHIASYASAAEIFETRLQSFLSSRQQRLKAATWCSFSRTLRPAIYARAFLEGRLSEEQLANFRQEVHGRGLCSYPHPWLMPEFWQFPTGSMGIGPINAIYQARFMRYLEHRGLAATVRAARLGRVRRRRDG